jgi:hypothetical protein
MDFNHDIDKRDRDLIDKQFLGIIERIDDPRREGRAKVRVISLHEEIPVDDLPWAYPKQKSVFFGQDGKAGSISVPKLGSVVAVKFDNGNPYSPEYFAIHELAEDVKSELDEEYEGSHIVLFDGDQELKIWFSPGKGVTLALRESSINIDQNNLITIRTPNRVVIDSPNIELGADAVESVIKGDSFKAIYDTHTHPSAGAPPAIPLPSGVLSKNTKTR